MANRTVLPNCCEPYVLQWGAYCKDGEEFACVPCGHRWRKEGEGEFTDLRPSPPIRYKRVVDALGFEELKPEGESALLVERCCSLILTEHGPNLWQLPFEFTCPRCKTPWSIAQSMGPDFPNIRLYTDTSTGRVFRLRDEGVPPYLELVAQSALVT